MTIVTKNSFYLHCLLCIVSLSACGQDYHGNNTDSIKHNVIEKDKTFLYFYQDDSDMSILSEFLLFDSLFSINIGQNNFKVDENLEKLQNIYPGSYAAYQENSSLYKSFRLIVFEGKKRKGLEIIFVIKENKIYNISTRYDE